jgi:hypothetical protein
VPSFFKTVPAGTYVLHIEANRNDIQFDPTDLLIRVAPTATEYPLDLIKMASGCGGFYLQPDTKH